MKSVRAFLSKNLTTILVICLCIIVVLTLFIAVKIYQIAAHETKASQGLQQLEMARGAATGIQYFLHHLSQDLRVLASFPGLQYFEPEPLRSNVDYFYANASREGVKIVFVVDRQGRLVYATSDSLPGWTNPYLKKKVVDLSANFSRDAVWYSQIFKMQPANSDSELCLLMLAPLIQYFTDSKHPNPSNEFVGVVGYFLSFDWLMQRFVQPVRVGKTGFAWVMDQQGRLLYHPRHPEMILRSIFDENKECRPCHANFSKQAAMINDEFKYEEYQVGAEPAKIMAQALMHISNENWIIAVSIDLEEVTAIMRKNYQLLFWLEGFILVSVILGGIFLLIFNLRRVRAEAAVRLNEQKRVLQGQIDQAARLASIGELVDSVAHEINTPLGIIHNRLEALKLKHKIVPYAEVIESVLDQSRRIGSYTKRLLRMSRRMPFQPTPTVLPEIIHDCLALLGHEIRKHRISVQTHWPKNLPRIKIDREQIQQVILNLLKNAIDSLDDSGEIRITIHRNSRQNGVRGLTVEIADTGSGIPAEDISQVFEPFFSTKPPSKGTGLGLHISRAIIERHGGTIKVESSVGEGSRFTIFLPWDLKLKENEDGEYFISG